MEEEKKFFFQGGWKVTYLLWYSSHTGFLPNRISPTQDPSHGIPPTRDPFYCIPPTWVHFTKKHFPFFSVIYLKENQDFIFKILFPNYFQIFSINCPLKILKIQVFYFDYMSEKVSYDFYTSSVLSSLHHEEVKYNSKPFLMFLI